MRIEESKPDYLQKQKLEKEEELLKLEKKRKREERWNNSDGFHAKDMSLITDNNVNTKAGKWKRGRYGRAIAVMRLKKSDGTKVYIKKKKKEIYIYANINYSSSY